MHLAEHYLKYVFAKTIADDAKVTLETVNYFLEKLGLPVFRKEHEVRIQVLADQFKPPHSFQFYNTQHKPTAEFMRQEKIYSMWEPDEAMGEVQKIFKYPAIKETIQLLLTGRLTPADISNRLPVKYERTFTPETIALFAHYFWNVSLVGAQDLEQLFYGSPMATHYLACFWGSRDQAVWRAGFSPRIDGHRALKEAHRSLFMRIEATRSLPDGIETARILATLSKELGALHGLLFGEGAGVEEMAKDLSKQVKMRQLPGNVVPITALAKAGNYTGSGVKHADSEE